MKRAIIIAKGEVQGVGYRGKVFKIARKLNITGLVENIKPYDVRIIAEGEKENLDNFVEQIKIEEDPILVEEVDVTFEEPTGEFEYFEVKRGDMTEELGERLDLARDEMKKLHQAQKDTLGKQDPMIGKQDETINELKAFREESGEKQDQMLQKEDSMLEKQDVMIGKQDETISILKSGVDETREFRTETQQNFANLDMKYGKIAENMEEIMKSMEDTSRKTGEVLERLAQQQENFNKSIDKLTDAILTLAKKSR